MVKFLSIPSFSTTVNSEELDNYEEGHCLSEIVLEFIKVVFVNYPDIELLKFLFPTLATLKSCKSIKSAYKLSAFYFAFVLISICYL